MQGWFYMFSRLASCPKEANIGNSITRLGKLNLSSYIPRMGPKPWLYESLDIK